MIVATVCSSQTISQKDKHASKETPILIEKKSTLTSNLNDSLSINDVKNKVELKTFEKSRIPSNQKISPEIFYIINDKPVSREEYLKLKNNK
jgi:hypothetical protein